MYCGSKMQVTNSRLQKKANQVWRRRKCQICQIIFTTTESIDYSSIWVVTNRSGQIAPFSKDVLFLSIYKVLEHRPQAILDASALTDTIVSRLLNKVSGDSLTTKIIQQVTKVTLNRFDKVAIVQYQALHPN